MHADSSKHITDEDMMKINKYMVNRLAYVFTLIIEDKWAEFNFLVEHMSMNGEHWDEVIVDDGGYTELFHKSINHFRN